MRKVPLIPGAAAVLGLVTIGLVGCSTGTVSSCTPAAADSTLADLVTVTGEVGEAPEVDAYAPFHVTSSSSARLVEGEGTPVTTDAQIATLDFTILDGTTGEVVYDSGYAGSTGPVSGLTQLIPAASDALHCAAGGSRTVIGVAPGGMIAEAAASLGLADDDSAIVVVDISKVYLPHAEGTLVFNAGGGLPAVVRAPDGRPGITVPDAPAPTEAASQTLIRGEGEEVTADAPVRVHYTIVDWDSEDGEVVESTWDATPQSLSLQAIPASIADALVGQPVGSQVLVVVPATEAEGDPASAQPAQVFVFDILGIDPVAAP